MKGPEASLPALIFFAPFFVSENPNDDGRQERKDETYRQKVQLPNHGTSYRAVVGNLTWAAHIFQTIFLGFCRIFSWNQSLSGTSPRRAYGYSVLYSCGRRPRRIRSECMSAIAFPVLVFALLMCVPLAGRMAVRRDRSAKLWMWLAAFLGPLPIAVLAFIPKPRPT